MFAYSGLQCHENTLMLANIVAFNHLALAGGVSLGDNVTITSVYERSMCVFFNGYPETAALSLKMPTSISYEDD